MHWFDLAGRGTVLAFALASVFGAAPSAASAASPPASIAAFRALVESANACASLRKNAGVHIVGTIEAFGVKAWSEATYAIATDFSRTMTVVPSAGGMTVSGYDGENWSTAPRDAGASHGVTVVPAASWAYTCGQPGNHGNDYHGLARVTDGGRAFDTVRVTSPAGDDTTLRFDAVSHYLVSSADAHSRVDYEDYRKIAGIPFAFRTKLSALTGGSPHLYGSFAIDALQVERALPPDALDRPPEVR